MATKDEIRPFSFHAPEVSRGFPQAHRRDKVAGPGTGRGDAQGVQLATMQKLARYWANEHDWRKCEAKINAAAELHHQYRWARHSFHSCSLEA